MQRSILEMQMTNLRLRCNNCDTIFESDEHLVVVFDEKDKEYVLGCPTCNTDAYLMDIGEQ